MKNILYFLIIFFAFTMQHASAAVTLSGCTGGDFGDDCSLAELHAGGSIQINDLLFDNWSVSVNAGSLNLISVTAIDDGSVEPGPGLFFKGPGAVVNESIGFEMNYDVSTIGATPKLTGYEVTIGFMDRLGTANGFAAMEVTDNVLLDTFSSPVEIANPEPTVTETIPTLSDLFTNCNNDGNCPGTTPPLSYVISSNFKVTTNLDVGGGPSGSFTSFDLTERFSLVNTTGTTPILSGCTGGDFGDACSLAELDAGGSIQVDDILFDNWDVNVSQGSPNLISVLAIDEASSNPGPGLLFKGPGAGSNQSIIFEMNYDVSTTSTTKKLNGYEAMLGFPGRTGTASGFAAMEVTDNVLLDSSNLPVEIANPEPTVTETIPTLSDLFTNCNNDPDCPAITPPLSRVMSMDFRVTTNLDVGGGPVGSFFFFDLAQRFSLPNSASLCFPIKAKIKKVVTICL